MVGEGNRKMKISLLWFWDKAEWVFFNWRDGVRAAMEELERRGHTVEWCLGTSVKVNPESDYILIWGDSRCAGFDYVKDHKAKKGLLLTTDLGMDINSLRKYDVVFAEAQCVVDKIKPYGIRVVKAFGTDTNYFYKDTTSHLGLPESYEAFYPATFSPWKRQDVFASKWKDKGLCVGTVQPDGWDILKRTTDEGTKICLGYFSVDTLIDVFYTSARSVDITGWEGSGRTVLEALSMGLPVTASEDNHKCQEYIQEWKASKLEPREFANKFYSASVYADQLLKGING